MWPALLLLLAARAFAVWRPRGLPEVVVAAPAAAVVLLVGLVPAAGAVAKVVELAPTLLFLAAVLVLAHLADVAGMFGWLGRVVAGRAAGRHGDC